MVAFNNVFQMECSCTKAPSMFAQHVEQFIMPLGLTCTCHGSPCQMTSWLNSPWNILHPNPPHITFASLPTKHVSDLKVFWCCLAICRGEFGVFDSPWTKNYSRVTHQHISFTSMKFHSMANTYKDRVTSCMHVVSPQSHMPMYITSNSTSTKCNMMLSFDKSFCKFSKMVYYIHNVHEAHVSFT
jgi:hypothetical protein